MDENLSPLRFGDLNSDRIYCMRENGTRGGKIICDYLSIDLNVLFFNSCFFFFYYNVNDTRANNDVFLICLLKIYNCKFAIIYILNLAVFNILVILITLL